MKKFINTNLSPTDPSKEKKIMYYTNFNKTNFIIRNNYLPTLPKKVNVGHSTITLSRRLTLHMNDSSSIAEHLQKHSCPHSQFRIILVDNTRILHHERNRQKLQFIEANIIKKWKPTLNKITYEYSMFWNAYSI